MTPYRGGLNIPGKLHSENKQKGIMEASEADRQKQQIEHEARQASGGGEVQPVPADFQPTGDPHADPSGEQPAPAPEVLEHVDVPCAGCGRVYGFDIQPNCATFTFQCRGCDTRSEWTRT